MNFVPGSEMCQKRRNYYSPVNAVPVHADIYNNPERNDAKSPGMCNR